MIRAFVGLALAPQITARLETLECGLPGARWVAPRNMHLTLVFLGEIEDGVLHEFAQDLSHIHLPVFALSVDGLGTFGRSKPRMVWAGVKPNAALDHLQAKIATLAQDHEIVIDRRKFTPHITLARLSDTPPSRLASFLAGNLPFAGGEMGVEHITLFQSHLGRDGAEYEVLAHFPLHAEDENGDGVFPTIP